MTTHDQGSRGAVVTSTDHIGKAFIVVGQDVRRCLVCEGMFTRKGASAHFNLICRPQRTNLRGSGESKYANR